MLQEISSHFPELFGWSQWSYCYEGELRFGHHRILSTTGVQQGDPLGPLLFSLVLSKLLEDLNSDTFQLWYLDDGTLIGTRSEVARIYNYLAATGPKFGLHLNPRKSQLFWPTGDQSFPLFHQDISRLTEGVMLLGTPLWGSNQFIASSIAGKVIQDVEGLHSSSPAYR